MNLAYRAARQFYKAEDSSNNNLTRIFDHIRQTYGAFPNNYVKDFRIAFDLFNHQLVFDPIRRMQCDLQGSIGQLDENLGKKFDNALMHAQGNLPSRSDFEMEQVTVDSILIRIPEGYKEQTITYRMLDIWSKHYKIDNSPIENGIKVNFNEDRNYFEKAWQQQEHTGVSDFWQTYKDTEPIQFEAYIMGKVSNCMDILPFRWLDQDEESQIIKCFCSIEAEKREIIFNNENPNFASNSDEYMGGYFYVCKASNTKDDCKFFHIVKGAKELNLQEFIIDDNLTEYAALLDNQNATNKMSDGKDLPFDENN
jgi:hypothetical protein